MLLLSTPPHPSLQVQRRIRILEDRLQQCTVRYNEMLTRSARLRARIDSLRRERLLFEELAGKLGRGLERRKAEMVEVIARIAEAHEAREKVGVGGCRQRRGSKQRGAGQGTGPLARERAGKQGCCTLPGSLAHLPLHSRLLPPPCHCAALAKLPVAKSGVPHPTPRRPSSCKARSRRRQRRMWPTTRPSGASSPTWWRQTAVPARRGARKR